MAVSLEPHELAKMIDYTLLKPDISDQDLLIHCERAKEYGFKTVAVNNSAIRFCVRQLLCSDILVDAAVGFPLGQSTAETKVFETVDAIEKGAGEVDYVVNLLEVKNHNWTYVEDEMRRIVAECKKRGVVSKVIFENCYLTEHEKIQLCEIAMKVRPSFIKTSTGFGPGGATDGDIRLMKYCVGDRVRIKAAGGIRTVKHLLTMITNGASRTGTSKGCEIIEEYRTVYKEEI